MESREQALFQSLQRFYTDPKHLKTLTETLHGNSKISLRILDWFVTNYSKKFNIIYNYNDTTVNVFLQYKSQLKAYSKHLFDPFCRRTRIEFLDYYGRQFTTTIGQLAFFRWGIVAGVIDYVLKHSTSIEHDMLESIKHRSQQSVTHKEVVEEEEEEEEAHKKKRKELSKAAIKSHTHTVLRVKVTF
jgi:hypothetical protein